VRMCVSFEISWFTARLKCVVLNRLESTGEINNHHHQAQAIRNMQCIMQNLYGSEDRGGETEGRRERASTRGQSESDRTDGGTDSE